MKKAGIQKRKEFKRSKLPPLPEIKEEDPSGTTYGLTKNTFFLRLYDTTINKYHHGKMCAALQFNPPLVIDMSYDEHMTTREANNCSKQLEMLITDNRRHRDPLNLYLCNAKKDSTVMQYLYRKIPTLYDDSYVLNMSEKSYLDLFPREQLVYLSPHAKDDLEEYNDDDIYIVGAMVDKTDPRPFSLAKAKKDKLRMKKLPLDKHLNWGIGSKSLTVNQMGNILIELRDSRSWEKALKFVPTRKIRRDYEEDSGRAGPSSFRKEKKSLVYDDAYLLTRSRGMRVKGN